MPQIASTLTSDVSYNVWRKKEKNAPGGPNTLETRVLIHGGHGVAHRRANGGLDTPVGVMTTVTDEQLALLKANECFQTHLKNGFVRIVETPRKVEAEKVAKDMATKEPSAPLDDADYKAGGRAQAPETIKLSLGKGKSK